jgi:hypothetical protein
MKMPTDLRCKRDQVRRWRACITSAEALRLPTLEATREKFGRRKVIVVHMAPRLAGHLHQLDHSLRLRRCIVSGDEAGLPPSNWPAWLHQVVRSTVANDCRAGRLDIEPLEEEPADHAPEDDAAFQALATCMQPLTATLLPLYRDALLGADFQDQPLAILAAKGGASVFAIKSRVSRARAMLRARLPMCCAVAHGSNGKAEGFQAHAGTRCACRSGKA